MNHTNKHLWRYIALEALGNAWEKEHVFFFPSLANKLQQDAICTSKLNCRRARGSARQWHLSLCIIAASDIYHLYSFMKLTASRKVLYWISQYIVCWNFGIRALALQYIMSLANGQTWWVALRKSNNGLAVQAVLQRNSETYSRSVGCYLVLYLDFYSVCNVNTKCLVINVC